MMIEARLLSAVPHARGALWLVPSDRIIRVYPFTMLKRFMMTAPIAAISAKPWLLACPALSTKIVTARRP
jgi:hypothetical protein